MAAFQAISAALRAQPTQPEPIERWRALQIDQAIVAYLQGDNGKAVEYAARSQLSALDIPAEELSRPLHESLEQLRERFQALRDYYGL